MLLRRAARQYSSRHPSFRLYSIPINPRSENQNVVSPPIPPLKKPKIDLRPPPIKPKPPTQPSQKIPRSLSHPPTIPKLSIAKENVQQDLHNAEANGLLTPPPPNANWFRKTLHQGIQLFKFYWRGVKLIFTRRRQISVIKARIASGGNPLTRAEFRLIQIQKDDIKKVIPFVIIALILEEIIPLIAIYAPFMLPSTCILPSQRDRIEAKRAEKARDFALQYKQVYNDLKRMKKNGLLPLSSLSYSDAPIAVCGLLRLSTIGIDFLRIQRIRSHLEFIAKDDQLLLQQDISSLTNRELIETLEERGIITSGVSQRDLQGHLLWWLENVKAFTITPIDDKVLARRLALAISGR